MQIPYKGSSPSARLHHLARLAHLLRIKLNARLILVPGVHRLGSVGEGGTAVSASCINVNPLEFLSTLGEFTFLGYSLGVFITVKYSLYR